MLTRSRRCLLCLRCRSGWPSRSILLNHSTELFRRRVLIVQIQALWWTGLADLVQCVITCFVLLLWWVLIVLYLGLLVGCVSLAGFENRFGHWVLWRGWCGDFEWLMHRVIRSCLMLRSTLGVLVLMRWYHLIVWSCDSRAQFPGRLILANRCLVEKTWYLLVHLCMIKLIIVSLQSRLFGL